MNDLHIEHAFIGFLIFMVMCSYIGGTAAKKSGREAMGAFLGLILGPVGILIAASLRPSRLQNCPDCGRRVSKKASTCPYCGGPV
jgi:hypothetical protein